MYCPNHSTIRQHQM